jgi:serine/threonine protein kinase
VLGSNLDGYEFIEELGRGGMGVVFKARERKLNRIVAVKTMLAGPLASPVELQRFRAEAEAAAHLQHPNIVAIHEIGEHNGLPYFTMDFVAGGNFAEGVRTGPLDARRAAAHLKTVAQAVHYAHQRGILHRDLKPSNVLLDQFGQPRITDFGLARRLDEDSNLTRTGQILGTPNFIPPEQAAPEHGPSGPHSDVYSLGAILYFLLTAQAPFSGKTLEETLSRVLNAEPIRPRRFNPTVPRDLETICLKCLEKDPSRRYATAQSLAEELGRFLEGEPIVARPIGPLPRFWRMCRRHPVTASLAISLALTATTLAITLMATKRNPGAAPTRSLTVASRPSSHYSGSVPTVVAVDGATLAQRIAGPGRGVAVDLKNGNHWAATLFNGGVLVRAGKSQVVITNLALGDCPGNTAVDSVHRVVWVDAQCGHLNDLVWALNADSYEILAGPIYCGGINGAPTVVNPVTGRFYHMVSDHPERIHPTNYVQSATAFGPIVGVNPKTGLLYAMGPGGCLQIIDGAPDPEVVLTNLTLPFPSLNNPIGVDPILNRIYVPNSGSNNIVILDGRTGQNFGSIELRTEQPLRRVDGVAVDAERKRIYALASAADNSRCWLFAIQGETQQVIRLPKETIGPVLNPISDEVYLWNP